MREGSLCSGYGGLTLALKPLWSGASVAWHAEIDPWASKVLAEHWPGVPNLGDLNDIDWSTVEPVNVLTAGYPCQPFSTAGRREGEADERHLWPQVLRAVRYLRPQLVLLENVAGHLSLGFGRVLGDLAEAGYVGSWRCLRASDVGACHRRERVFIVAHPHGTGQESGHGLPEPGGRTGSARGTTPDTDLEPAGWYGGATPGSPNIGDRPSDGLAAAPDTSFAERRGPEQPDLETTRWRTADSRECSSDIAAFGIFQPAVDRWAATIGRPAPAGLDGKRLNARFVEWMMGLPDGWVTDLVPRRHALRILGNGVVPQQATAAFRSLLDIRAQLEQWAEQ